MSVAHQKVAYGLRDLPATAKSVLACLAFHSNKRGVCFPSHALLSEETGLSVPAVRKALYWLRDHQYLKTTKRKKNDGWDTSNLYELTLGRGAPNITRGDTTDHPGCSHISPLIAKAISTNRSTNRKKKANENSFAKESKLKAKDVLKTEQWKQNKYSPPSIAGKMEQVWKHEVGSLYQGMFKGWTGKEKGQAKLIAKEFGIESVAMVEWVVVHWGEFTNRVRQEAGVKTVPSVPHIGFLLKHAASGFNGLNKVPIHLSEEPAKPQVGSKGKLLKTTDFNWDE